MPRNQVRDGSGNLLYEHYYLAGGHVYEIPRGRGQKRAKICFEETPRGDGAVIWEENHGAQELELAQVKAEASS